MHGDAVPLKSPNAFLERQGEGPITPKINGIVSSKTVSQPKERAFVQSGDDALVQIRKLTETTTLAETRKAVPNESWQERTHSSILSRGHRKDFLDDLTLPGLVKAQTDAFAERVGASTRTESIEHRSEANLRDEALYINE